MPSCHLEVQVQSINVSFTVAKMTISGVHILKKKTQAFEIIQVQLFYTGNHEIQMSYIHNIIKVMKSALGAKLHVKKNPYL